MEYHFPLVKLELQMSLFIMGDKTGLPRSEKSQGKTITFEGQGKVREFCKRLRKILDVCSSH